jgi:hypothetical protein
VIRRVSSWAGIWTGQTAITRCHVDELNHAVLLMGYGVDEESKTPYWTLKNRSVCCNLGCGARRWLVTDGSVVVSFAS